ncbi:MAG: PGF-pre-PGF domain-containing protein, partial [Candidatus Aenigmatarchaeota archaeon]
ANNVTLYMNDTNGNINSSTVFWTLDTTGPNITINLPLNASVTDTTPTFNVSFGEVVNWSLYSIDGGSNVSMGAISTYQTTLGALSYGSHYITVHANNTVGNMTSSVRYFTISASSTTTSSGGGGGGGSSSGNTTVSETQSLASLSSGTAGSFKFAQSSKLSIQQIDITPNTDVSSVVLTIKEESAKPESAPAPSGKVHKYLTIRALNIDDSKIEGALIKFKINRTWITENNIELGSVKLNRLVGSSWEALPTAYDRSDTDYYYFASVTKGFSLFSITGEAIKEENEKQPDAGNGTRQDICGDDICQISEDCRCDDCACGEGMHCANGFCVPATEEKTADYATYVVALVVIAVIMAFLAIAFVRRATSK